MTEEVVALGDELDVRVLDAVVDHLHEMARAVGTDVGAARHAVDVGGDRLQHLLDSVVRLARPSWHQAGTMEGALFPAGYAHAKEPEPALRGDRCATACVVEQ